MAVFTNALVRRFIKDSKNIDTIEVRAQYEILEGWVSIVLNILLFAVKLGAGLFINSIALIADAFHTLSDLVSSIAIIWGAKFSSTPADEKHPFGHERMEYITTLFIAVLLIVTGVEFFKATVERTLHPEKVIFNGMIIFLFVLTIIIKEWLARFSEILGKRIDSQTLIGDAKHHRTDVITSLLVLVALFSDKFSISYLDGIIGIIVSLYIIYSGCQMVYEGISPLLGESPTLEELKKVKSIALAVDKVKGVHDIIMHKYGKVRIISLHVEIPEEIPFMDGHDIIEEVEEKINLEMKATTVIHLDPLQKMTEELKDVHAVLQEVVRSDSRVDSYHDVRVVKFKGGRNLIFDIVASHETKISKDLHLLKHDLRDQVGTALPDYTTVKVWIEPKFHLSI